MALLDPTVTITPISVQYYERTYHTTYDEGVRYVKDDNRELYIPWNQAIHGKHFNEYVFIELDIHNHSSKDIKINHCHAEVLSPANIYVGALPALKLANVLKPGNVLEGALFSLPYSIKPDDLLGLPITLESKRNYYRHLCLKIIKFPERVDDVRIKIELIEGFDAKNREYRCLVRLDKTPLGVYLNRDSKFWKVIDYDENGFIKGLR